MQRLHLCVFISILAWVPCFSYSQESEDSQGEKKGEEGEKNENKSAVSSKVTTGGIYSRPFVKKFGKGTFLGGYFDTEFKNTFDTGNDVTTFDQHRLIPFIYAEIHPRLHFGSEIEFEHGGFVSGDPTEGTDGEIKIEFATLDFSIYEWLNFRGGLILSPLGRFNLLHDSPMNELTDRPLVARNIIPTTLSEVGVGFFGTMYPSEMSVLSYEIYAVNGFNQDLMTPSGTNLREGRGGAGSDNNRAKSLVSRVAFSPLLGVEIGNSIHTGAYSDNSEDWLTLWALDGAFTRGSFEFLGEYAHAYVENGSNQHGVYGQIGYRFLHGAFSALPGSFFTGLVRYDWIDLTAGQIGANQDRLTVGLNFRPVQETVFKVDYAFLGSTASGTSNRMDDGGQLAFSLATYF